MRKVIYNVGIVEAIDMCRIWVNPIINKLEAMLIIVAKWDDSHNYIGKRLPPHNSCVENHCVTNVLCINIEMEYKNSLVTHNVQLH